MLDSPVHETTLPNGLRIATEFVPHALGVTVGLRLDVGSRDEAESEAGISHVLEHMVFKGTERRTARDIAEEMDAVGGQMDAYTTKDYTAYGARVLPEHVPLAIDVLADMLRHSRLDPSDLELEQSVILEEYRSMEDAPEEYVHEVFTEAMWPQHPLGRPIIGRPAVIASLSTEDLRRYLSTHYRAPRLIACAAGNLEHDAFVAEIERQFGDLNGAQPERMLETPVARTSENRIHRPLEQAHFCMGGPGVSEADDDRWAVRILSLILGGGMSSRLFQEIREKRGLCYNIGCESTSYREAGQFVIFADTSLEQLDAVRLLIRQELDRLVQEGLLTTELTRAKEQVRAATLLSLDDTGSRMGRLAHSLLYRGRVVPLAELVELVEAVTREDCLRAARRLFSDELSFAAIGPFRSRKKRTA